MVIGYTGASESLRGSRRSGGNLLGELPPLDQPVTSTRLVDVLRLGDRPPVGLRDLSACWGVEGSLEVTRVDAQLGLDHLTVNQMDVGRHQEFGQSAIAPVGVI